MFEVMLAREFEEPACAEVHHLTVMCYNLQHPQQFTPAALAWSRSALQQVLEQGLPPGELLRRSRQVYGSPGKAKVTRQPRPGEAVQSVPWSLTIADAIGETSAGHNQRVQSWAWAVLADLKKLELYI